MNSTLKWTLVFLALLAAGFAGAWWLGLQMTQEGIYFVLASSLLLIVLLAGLYLLVQKEN